MTLSRRHLLAAALALPPTFAAAQPAPDTLGFTPDPASLARATALLARHGAADLHAHPGAIVSRPLDQPRDVARESETVAALRAGFVTACSFAVVADTSVLVRGPDGITVGRDLKPGESWDLFQRQIADLAAVAKARGLTLLHTPADLARLKPGRDAGLLLCVEGGDFIEEDIARLAQAHRAGVRGVTLVHYRPNALADNQTSPPSHGGLTPLGARVVKEMNRLRMLVDVAHAAETTVRQVLDRSTAPILCSHTILKSPAFDHPRFITPETAKAVAAHGGLIGAWPSGFGVTTMAGFIDRIFRLTDAVGADHAALGTDMDGNYQPVMTTYRQTPVLVSELLRRGYGEAEAVKFIGGNFRRVWARVAAG